VRLNPLGTSATNWPIVPAPDDECEAVAGMRIGRGNRSTREKTCQSATLCTTNPTRRDLGSNWGRRGGKPATNRLSYVAAYYILWVRFICIVQYVKTITVPLGREFHCCLVYQGKFTLDKNVPCSFQCSAHITIIMSFHNNDFEVCSYLHGAPIKIVLSVRLYA
jgi:hypothetical protein